MTRPDPIQPSDPHARAMLDAYAKALNLAQCSELMTDWFEVGLAWRAYMDAVRRAETATREPALGSN